MEDYGSVHAINLLGSKENEASLTMAYARHLQVAKGMLGDDLGITNFDFHNAVRIGGHDSVIREIRCGTLCYERIVILPSHNPRRLETITEIVDRFGFTMSDASTEEIITEQKGVFRTNCLDWFASLVVRLSFSA
jgi:hypothetical protein